VLLAALFGGLAATAWADPPNPGSYDTFLRSDYGRVKLWFNSATGDFYWEDPGRKLVLAGTGSLEFPNLGPIILTFAGPLPGYDWVSVTLKIYGTTATGVMAVFPEGQPTRKVVSNFYDRDTRDDLPKVRKAPAPKPKPEPPKVEGINPVPKEVPALQPPPGN
jgi:hypothetical protein